MSDDAPEDRVRTLERENAELRERNDELETKLHAKLEALNALQRTGSPTAVGERVIGPVPGILMIAGGLAGVAGAFAANLLAMLGGLVMLSAGVWWGQKAQIRSAP